MHSDVLDATSTGSVEDVASLPRLPGWVLWLGGLPSHVMLILSGGLSDPPKSMALAQKTKAVLAYVQERWVLTRCSLHDMLIPRLRPC